MATKTAPAPETADYVIVYEQLHSPGRSLNGQWLQRQRNVVRGMTPDQVTTIVEAETKFAMQTPILAAKIKDAKGRISAIKIGSDQLPVFDGIESYNNGKVAMAEAATVEAAKAKLLSSITAEQLEILGADGVKNILATIAKNAADAEENAQAVADKAEADKAEAEATPAPAAS